MLAVGTEIACGLPKADRGDCRSREEQSEGDCQWKRGEGETADPQDLAWLLAALHQCVESGLAVVAG